MNTRYQWNIICASNHFHVGSIHFHVGPIEFSNTGIGFFFFQKLFLTSNYCLKHSWKYLLTIRQDLLKLKPFISFFNWCAKIYKKNISSINDTFLVPIILYFLRRSVHTLSKVCLSIFYYDKHFTSLSKTKSYKSSIVDKVYSMTWDFLIFVDKLCKDENT